MVDNITNAPKDISLSNFISSLNRVGGAARLARFIAVIRPTDRNPLKNKTGDLRNLIFACYQTEFPSRGFTKLPTRYYGPAQTFPINPEYEPIGMSFICRNDLMERKFFDDWMDIMNPTTTFNFAYPEEYYCDIVLYQYSEFGDDNNNPVPKYMWTLRKAWPSAIGKQAVTWQDTDFLYFDVEFTYKYWDRSPAVGEESTQVGEPSFI